MTTAPRNLKAKLKTARGRPIGSQIWLQRQLNDPYVHEAKRLGYRSRAAFKLIQLDDKYRLLRKGQRVLDLGAAPGGWTQVAVERIGSEGTVLAVDILPMDGIGGAKVMQLDFLAEGADRAIRDMLGGAVDIVLSDMAPPATGHKQTDHLRIMALCDAAADFALKVLAPGGAFVCKTWQGGASGELVTALKRRFGVVRHAKPDASRKDSAETFLVASGLKAPESA